jgi:hypothetical protein
MMNKDGCISVLSRVPDALRNIWNSLASKFNR